MTGQDHAPPPATPVAPKGWLAWFRLMRLPTGFTALADILCGYLLTHRIEVQELVKESQLWALLLASACLYLSGMVLNDVFDAALDSVERPERPVPSGAISRRSAAVLGFGMMSFGILAAFLAGFPSLVVAAVLAFAILSYDGWLKATVAGPVVMGSCRGLNILLGASTASPMPPLVDSPQVLAAVGLMIWVIGVTVFARNEAGNASAQLMVTGIFVSLAGLILDGGMIARHGRDDSAVFAGWVLLAVLGTNLVIRGGMAIRDPRPRVIQKTVGLMLLCIILLDAAVVFAVTADPKLALVIVALVIPATLLKRVIPLS